MPIVTLLKLSLSVSQFPPGGCRFLVFNKSRRPVHVYFYIKRTDTHTSQRNYGKGGQTTQRLIAKGDAIRHPSSPEPRYRAKRPARPCRRRRPVHMPPSTQDPTSKRQVGLRSPCEQRSACTRPTTRATVDVVRTVLLVLPPRAPSARGSHVDAVGRTDGGPGEECVSPCAAGQRVAAID